MALGICRHGDLRAGHVTEATSPKKVFSYGIGASGATVDNDGKESIATGRVNVRWYGQGTIVRSRWEVEGRGRTLVSKREKITTVYERRAFVDG